MFEMLASVDLFVESAQEAYNRLAEPLGLYEPRGMWYQDWPEWGFDARWCRVNLDLAIAPTHLEIIAPYRPADTALNHPHMAEMFDAQRPRLYKTHSTPVSTDAIDTLASRLSRSGATFRLDEPEGKLSFPRLWLGRSADRPGWYDPAADGGLFLEFIPPMNFPHPDATRAPKPASAAHPVHRIAARRMLVNDLEATVRTVDRNLGWTPATEIRSRNDSLTAQYTFDHPGSAVLEVVQPGPGTREAKYGDVWGAGPYGIVFEVTDLYAVAERLRRAGFDFEIQQVDDVPTLLPDHLETHGAQFEIRRAC